MTPATSAGGPARRTGVIAARSCVNCSSVVPSRSARPAVMSVTMKPGAMAFAVTPNGRPTGFFPNGVNGTIR